MGNQARPCSKKKQVWVSKFLKNPNAHGGLHSLVVECKPLRAVRLNGSGDLIPEHVQTILSLAEACPETQFWGMTRKPEIAETLNQVHNLHLMVSVDASSPESVWNHQGALCYGPRHADDQVPEDDRIKVVFPKHVTGRVLKAIKKHPKDCMGTWHEIDGCMDCGRCWQWKKT